MCMEFLLKQELFKLRVGLQTLPVLQNKRLRKKASFILFTDIPSSDIKCLYLYDVRPYT